MKSSTLSDFVNNFSKYYKNGGHYFFNLAVKEVIFEWFHRIGLNYDDYSINPHYVSHFLQLQCQSNYQEITEFSPALISYLDQLKNKKLSADSGKQIVQDRSPLNIRIFQKDMTSLIILTRAIVWTKLLRYLRISAKKLIYSSENLIKETINAYTKKVIVDL